MSYTGTPPSHLTFPVDYFSGNGVQTNFQLSYPVPANNSLLVTVDNVQIFANQYRVDEGKTLIFLNTAPPAGTNNIEVLYLGSPAISEAITGVTSLGISTTLSGLTIENSPITNFGNISIGGTLGVQSGGTGANVFTNYQLLVGNGSSPVTSLGTLGAAKQALVSQGTGLIPSWQNIVNSFSAGSSGLTPATASTGDIVLSGILNVATGGTGGVNFANNRLLIGNGTAPLAQVASTGTLGQVLTSQGNNPPIWSTVAVQSIAAPPTFGITVTNTAGAVTLGGVLSIANGGTNNTSIVANSLMLANIAGTAYTTLTGPGTTGQVLTSQGASSPPVWQLPGLLQAWTSSTTPPIGCLVLATYQNGSGGNIINPVPGVVVTMDGTNRRLVQGNNNILVNGNYLCVGSFINSASSCWVRMT